MFRKVQPKEEKKYRCFDEEETYIYYAVSIIIPWLMCVLITAVGNCTCITNGDLLQSI